MFLAAVKSDSQKKLCIDNKKHITPIYFTLMHHSNITENASAPKKKPESWVITVCVHHVCTLHCGHGG